MSTLRSRGATPVLLALFSATLACGGGAPVAPASTATITLTDTGCVADGLGALVPEHFAATLVNKNPFEARFNLQRMVVGHAYRELELHIEEQQRRFVAGIDQMNPPSFTTIVWLTIVDPKQSDRVDLTLFSGTYGLVCRGVKSPTLWSAYVVGPFRVP